MPDDAETETLRSFASQDRNASTSLLPGRLPGDAHRGNG